eukprot:3035470-Rhodomonas_salina.2
MRFQALFKGLLEAGDREIRRPRLQMSDSSSGLHGKADVLCTQTAHFVEALGPGVLSLNHNFQPASSRVPGYGRTSCWKLESGVSASTDHWK